ncbi:MAG: HAMP domain-containing methyl-accepting chemotaxis protein [Acidobacteriota bacterium]
MSGWTSRSQKFLYDLLPILFALFVAVVYFLTVVPNTRPYWEKYLLVVLVLLVVDRILITWYMRVKLLPPILAYKRGKRAGKAFSRQELEAFYRALASHVLRHQVVSGIAWAVAGLVLAAIVFLYLQRTWVAFLGVLFTGAIAASISLGFTYFLLQRQTRPLIEEIQTGLDRLPDVARWRLSFGGKVGASIVLLTVLAFLAFGVLIYSRLSMGLADFAVRAGMGPGGSLAAQLRAADAAEWPRILSSRPDSLWTLVAVQADGAVLGQTEGDFRVESLAAGLEAGRGVTESRVLPTNWGPVAVFPLGGDRTAVLLPQRSSLRSVLRDLSATSAGFLVGTLLVLGGYIIWLSRDTGRALSRTAEFSRRLASGDLTKVPAIWSDDEMGHMADNLRSTFQGLRKMTHEVAGASSAVEVEVSKTAEVVGGLHQMVASQTQSAGRTTDAVKAMEARMVQVSGSMDQVASSTQEVSSAILEMQASVEEIARNADVLIRSVEATVSSSNEIASSADEVKEATDRLHGSGQEAVSFLTQLDASLEETRRNSQALADASGKVTQDAEAGFSSVAAVEDGILKTRNASEESRGTLRELMDSIEKIGRIVGVIQEVTEQTNLLSLNASIIAAGAGEHGKPFAVVATQIRELSSRTAGHAKEIRAVITKLTESGGEMAASMDHTFRVVDASTVLSRQAGVALRTILESASTQEEMSKRIASATEELAHGGQSASRAMHEIFERMEGIARATQEQAASTRFLNVEAERVREVAGQLRNATEEQAKGSRVISEAVTRIMEDSRKTNQAIQAQAHEAKAISEAMRQVAGAAQTIEKAFVDLAAAASTLQQSANVLRREIRAFRV